jgi:hypothetical protein
MAINPIPVTFHLSADARPDLIEAQRRRARPYRVIVQGVAMFAVMALGFAYIMVSMVDVHKSRVASSTPSSAPTRSAAVEPQPQFPVWQPSARDPSQQAAVAVPPYVAAPDRSPVIADRTPVATIPERQPARPRGFAPVERAPDYAGFTVTAGD